VVSFEQKQEYFDFINRILDVKFEAVKCVCIASIKPDGEIMGVVVYDRFSPWNCELSVASVTPKFIDRAFLRAVFRYPFIQCGLRRVTAVTEDGNDGALRINKRLGFVDEAKLKNWYGDTDGNMLVMTRESCKWL